MARASSFAQYTTNYYNRYGSSIGSSTTRSNYGGSSTTNYYNQYGGSTGSSTLVGGANSVDKFKIADGAGESTNTTIRNFSVDDVIELGTSISNVGSYSNKGTEITLDNGATVNVVGMTKNTYSSLKEGDTQISYTK